MAGGSTITWRTTPPGKKPENWRERRRREFEEAVFSGDLLKRIQTGTEHQDEKHVNVNGSYLVDRCLTEYDPAHPDKPAVASRFYGRDISELLENTLLDGVDEVLAWLDDKKARKPLCLTSEPQDGPVGESIIHDGKSIRHAETDTLQVVLAKGGGPYNPYGFHLVTAYPAVSAPVLFRGGPSASMKKTGKDLTIALHNSRTYRDAAIGEKKRLDAMAGTRYKQDDYGKMAARVLQASNIAAKQRQKAAKSTPGE